MSATSTITARPFTIAGYVAPGPVTGVSDAAPVTVDLRWAGNLRITGTTKNTGTPEPTPIGPRLVRLHDQKSGEPVRQTWSHPTTGAYAFDWIRQGTYYITAFDHTGQYGGVIETDVQTEAMP